MSAAVIPFERSPGYWANVWRRFCREKLAIAAGCVLLLILLMAIFAPLIAPKDPTVGAMLRRLRPIARRVSRWAPTSSAATCSRG